MANYFKQVLGYKSTEQPDDAMEKGRAAWSSSETLQPGVAERPAVVGGTALPSFSFRGPSPTSARTNMEVDNGPHSLRRPSEEPATLANKVRVVQSNSPLAHSVSLVVFS
jgi:hypothetical protein